MRVTDAECQIMKVLWASGPTVAEDLIRTVLKSNHWTEGTVRTLINRLIRKRAVLSRKEGGRAIYHPLLKQSDYIQTESQDLLDRLFEGQVAPLVVHFAKNRALTKKDIETLKKLIDGLGK